MSKLACALIVKDDSELKGLKVAIDSIKKYVDGIFITGTKEPQDKIKKYCKEIGANWSWYPWDKNFSNARNFNFKQVPKEFKWIFWVDTDDRVEGAQNFQKAIKIAEKNDVKAVFCRYLYQCEFDKNGNVKEILLEHLRERLIVNEDLFEWIAPIHETLIEQTPVAKTDFSGFVVVHMASDEDIGKSIYRNIEILEQNVIDNFQDPRPIYYLAKAYYDLKEPMLLYEKLGNGLESYTLELLKDYIRKSGWKEERAQCWEYISMIHRECGEYDKAIYALLEGIHEEDKFPSLYIQLALCYVYTKEWDRALRWINIAGTVEIPQTTLPINPKDYKLMMLEVYYHIYLNTGKLEKCGEVAEAMLKLMPNDLNEGRVKDISILNERNNVAHMIVKLASYLKKTKQYDRIAYLIDTIPEELAMEPVFVNLRNEFATPRTWGKDEVAIFCGPGWQQWGPKSTSNGIGGSEEAVIYLSRELVKRGWRVTVYADPSEGETLDNGVSYIPYHMINWRDNFNIFVVWRQIGVLDVPIRAKKIYVWNHDIQNPLTYTPERVAKVDKFMFLSKWHRDNVPNLPEDKVMLTANGVNI